MLVSYTHKLFGRIEIFKNKAPSPNISSSFNDEIEAKYGSHVIMNSSISRLDGSFLEHAVTLQSKNVARSIN